MRPVRMTRALAIGWITLGVSGCMSWRVESVSPREVVSRPGLNAVRLTTADSADSKIEVYDPTLVGDSISGHPTKLAVARIYVPLSHVRTIATPHKSIGKTALLILAVAGGVGIYALLQELNQGY